MAQRPLTVRDSRKQFVARLLAMPLSFCEALVNRLLGSIAIMPSAIARCSGESWRSEALIRFNLAVFLPSTRPRLFRLERVRPEVSRYRTELPFRNGRGPPRWSHEYSDAQPHSTRRMAQHQRASCDASSRKDRLDFSWSAVAAAA